MRKCLRHHGVRRNTYVYITVATSFSDLVASGCMTLMTMPHETSPRGRYLQAVRKCGNGERAHESPIRQYELIHIIRNY